MIFLINKDEITIKIPAEIYNSDVIHKCFYWYLKEYSVDISLEDNDYFVIKMESKKRLNNEDISLLKERIKQDIIDFKTRDIATKETKNIRDLLTAMAFSPIEKE